MHQKAVKGNQYEMKLPNVTYFNTTLATANYAFQKALKAQKIPPTILYRFDLLIFIALILIQSKKIDLVIIYIFYSNTNPCVFFCLLPNDTLLIFLPLQNMLLLCMRILF